MNSIPVAERAKSFQTASFNDNINEPTLGVKWDVTKDVFTFHIVKVKEEDVIKRNILKTVASNFDAVGFVASLLVTGKIFLQELWRLKVGWDDRITKSQCRQWERWKGELVNLKGVTVPRCHHPSRYLAKDIQLHIFCDASELANGAVACLKFEFELERSNFSFAMQQTDLLQLDSNPVWPNGSVFVYELSGCGFESSCSHLNFRFRACFEQGVP